ncbi:PAAR domain-containing protein [Caballeronia novacaledonica]|uniref:PAAR domain-containing protein n=1 Tax=Caballeronia novacaledonica TaxID=1544861 RepID=A0AA37I9S7_9BURK|nr:PAAR domain-containing protein [Caballeronia novacaledonica]GJH25433.1 PAAR domain-containing protein [Caballeronia novacaledonica]
MMRRFAVVGDKLSNNGEICDYKGLIFMLGGHQAALIDGAAYCPICKTTGYIAKEGGPRRMTLGASEIALENDVVVCGCPEHPRIFAKLAGEAWYDDLAENPGVIGSRAASNGSIEEATKRNRNEDKHTSWFYVWDSVTGEPLRNRNFVAHVAGIDQSGRTDDSGYAKIETDCESAIDMHVVFSSPKRNLSPGRAA